MSTEDIEKLLKLVAKYDCCSSIWWDESLRFYVNCNDLFHWGASDCEPISPQDFELFEQSLVDDEYDGPQLFCARKRKMRPQGAFYKHMDRDKWPLYDACGPERELGLSNPQNAK